MSIPKRFTFILVISFITLTCYSQTKSNDSIARDSLFRIYITYITRLAQNKDTSIATNYKTKQFDVALFPQWYFCLSVEGEKSSFNVTKQEADSSEYALKSYLKEQPYPIYKKLRKYKRQYFGYVDSNGHKILFINCFWNKEFNSEWLQQEIIVCDGGWYYWQIKFDLTTSKFFDFYVNGNA